MWVKSQHLLEPQTFNNHSHQMAGKIQKIQSPDKNEVAVE